MTTAVTRPLTVTARINTPDPTPAPGPCTATDYKNTHDDHFDGYQPHDGDHDFGHSDD